MLVSVFINNKHHSVQSRMSYERIVRLAGLSGNPSMIVSPPRHTDRRAFAPIVGQEFDLETGTHITVVHTGNA